MAAHKKIAILYHGGCPDGSGGAYAAWKKFGDTADYIPVKYGNPVPIHLDGKELYFVDFCYPQAIMDDLKKIAASIIVLDHHEGIRPVATSFSGIFDTSHSGAVIAWTYFHPNTSVPLLLQYVENGDLYKFELPHAQEILRYVYSTPVFSSFEHWDVLVRELEDPVEKERIIATGSMFSQYHTHIVENAVNHARLVRFEGYECYLVGSMREFRSDIGHRLAKKKPPIALVISADTEMVRVSLRSDGTADVAKLAQKYGGNGHPRAAGFEIPYGQPMPWTPVEKEHEDTGH